MDASHATDGSALSRNVTYLTYILTVKAYCTNNKSADSPEEWIRISKISVNCYLHQSLVTILTANVVA